ncbi:Galactose oxidase [Methylobacterium sp. 4-46]|nr:Galactose oxidase [Methylobacterium sp. 4-46]
MSRSSSLMGMPPAMRRPSRRERSVPRAMILVLLALAASPAAAEISFAARTGSGPIRALHSGMCLTVPGGNPAEAVQIEQQPCTGGADQTWQIRPAGGGFNLVNQATGLCLDSQMSRSGGSAVWQIRCLPVTQQIWSAQAQGGGVRLVAAYSGKCLDVYGGFATAGTKLIQWDCSGGTHQTFAAGASAEGGGTGAPGTRVSITLTAANGWYAKDLFLFARDAAGAVIAQTDLVTYDFGRQTAGMNLPSRPIALPVATASWGFGLRVWPNGDKSRNGPPVLYFSDAPGQRPFQSSGDCRFGNRQDLWGDAAAPGQNIVYSVSCTAASPGTDPGTPQALAVTLTPTEINGWYAKDVFLFIRNPDGTVGAQTTVASYNFGIGTPGLNLPSQPFGVPAGGRWGVGLRIWANGDKSRNGAPVLVYSDTPGERAVQIAGDCASAGGRQDVWGDAGAPGRNVVYTLRCSVPGGDADPGTGPGTGGGQTGGGPPPGEPAPTGASILINRRSGNCVDAGGGGVAQQICRDQASQTWTFVPTSGGYQIRSDLTGQCLAVENAGMGNGARVVPQGCSAAPNALFRLRRIDRWTEIVAMHSGRCLTPTGPNGNRTSGSAILQWDCDANDPQRWTILGPEGRAPSAWTAPREIGIVPVAGAVLPNGKLLFWAAEQRTSFGSGNGTWTTLYDPATDRATDTYIAQTGHDMFCPGTNVLPDGRILITGGISAGLATIYDPAANSWTRVADMTITRGYNASTTLSTGESFTFGGSWSGGAGGKDGEIWSAAANRWRVLRNVKGNAAADPSVAIYPGDTHFWLFASSNGAVFHAGPSTDMHWIDTAGDGTMRFAGRRGNDLFAVNGTATLYDVGKIYKAGGAPAYTGAPALDSAFTIDISAGPNGAVGLAEAAPMLFARAYANSVVLPDGDVVTAGGQNVAAQFTDNLPVMMPEIWSPRTGKVRRLAPMAVPRNYHSIGMLLLDGRVLFGGGGLCGGCGGADHLNFEILSPPYLFDARGNPASRPVLTRAPASAGLGSTIAVATDRAVAAFALVRLGSVTHSTNNDQRRVPLAIAAASGTTYQLALPADPGILLPGTWMLFALDGNGVPSVAKVVWIR